jgi:hypothetical protein
VAAKQRGQQGPGAAADIDDRPDRIPAAAELDVVVGDTMSGRSHQRVEFGRDPRVRGQVLPERPAEHPLVGRLAGADVVQQRAPGMRHPPADAVQVDEAARGRELPGRLVAREPAGRVLREDPAGNEMAEYGVQGIAVAPRRGGQRTDVGVAGGDVLSDAQGSRDMQAPRCGQVQHLLQVHPIPRGPVISHAGLLVPVYHRVVTFLLSPRRPALIRLASILPAGRGRGLGEKGHR